MSKSGFSMIELVFVIVILGVISAIAIPRFVATRTEAGIAILKNDINTVLTTVPARIFAESIDVTQNTPPDHSNWGEFIIDTAGLDRSRWRAFPKGIKPMDGDKVCDSKAAGLILIQVGTFFSNTMQASLIFDPSYLDKGSSFCNKLKDSYPSDSRRDIPLTGSRVVF